MPIWLSPHPASVAPAIKVRVALGRAGEHLLFSYRVVGDIARLMWCGEGEAGRHDELWRHGCFEAFVATDEQAYVELNMAPTERWASYSFVSYRTGVRDAEAVLRRQDWVPRPDLSIPRLELHARWELPAEFRFRALRLGLSAVIEEVDGTKSYWALAHAPGPPDFHNPACFIATLPPPSQA